MVTQYPHTMTVTTVTATTQDGNGNMVPGQRMVKTFDCRTEPNSGGRMIQTADGSSIVYASIVYMPLKTEAIPEQAHVHVTWKGTGAFVSSGKALLFSRGQLNCRLWLER